MFYSISLVLICYVSKLVASLTSRFFFEDQFGLGLIARAVEEGMAVIKPTGTMIFNVGG